jgi:DNA polymerase III subunit epsilon
MHFLLKHDLVFFDVETTGLNVLKDRIIQIALIKYFKDGSEKKELSMLINPGIPISTEAMQITGITPDLLRNKPSFQQVAEELYQFIGDADLAGYNSDRFDVPILIEEFHRSGFDFDISQRRLIDVQKVFYKMEPRTLKAAYKYYCNEELTGAHDALEDVRATVKVLQGQIKMYEGVDYEGDNGSVTNPITADIGGIAEFLKDHGTLDVTQRLKINGDGSIVFNFGKYIGRPVGQTLYEDRQYFQWIQDKEFSAQVKKMTKDLLHEYQEKMRLKLKS